jgi:glycosyltransferase involved in cell wall biosynthesis
MRVVHISTHDNGGGAARSAYRLHLGLRLLNQDSLMLVAERRGQDPQVKEAVRSRSLVPRLLRLARRQMLLRDARRYASTRPAHAGFFSDDRSEYGAGLAGQIPECEVLNLHFVAGLVDYGTFFRAPSARKPMVWTLHDANAFTGGCHTHGACGRFNQGCGACPELGSSSDKDLTHAIWQRKKGAYAHIPKERLHVVTPSRWLADEARQSTLLGGFPVSVIPYGIATDVFCPRNKLLAREMFGLPKDSKVVLFAAQYGGWAFKGFSLLVEALTPLASTDIYLFSVGSGTPSLTLPFPHMNTGFIDNDRILSWAYSAADLYVTPSLDDNLPNTVMESMSCGTPVIGFNVGGVPDMVRDGNTGFLAPKGDVGALRQAILRVLDNPPLGAELAANCRRIAVEEYDLRIQAQRYLELYTSLTNGRSG